MADIDSVRQGRPGPHFFCIGPGKSATTWIADHLKLHRDVWLPPIQEVSYLNAGFAHYRGSDHIRLQWDWWNVAKRVVRNKSLSPRRDREFFAAAQALAGKDDADRDLDGYRALFAPARGRLTGDISPGYASLGVDEIRSVRPVLDGAPVFMVARDPVQRFWSALSMYYRYRTYGDVDYGSLDTVQRLFDDPQRSRQHFPVRILDRWNEGLGEERLKVFFFDDIAEQPEPTFREIVRFIGGDYRKRIPFVRPAYNRQGGTERANITSDAREWVREAFQPELEACAARFGATGEKWLEKHRRPD